KPECKTAGGGAGEGVLVARTPCAIWLAVPRHRDRADARSRCRATLYPVTTRGTASWRCERSGWWRGVKRRNKLNISGASESFCCSVLGRLAASYRWRHSWQHAIESHAATDGGFIPGGRRSRVLSHSHSGTLDIRTAVRCGRERCREIAIATRAAERPFQC